MAEKEDRMQDLGNTQYFKVETEPETGVKLVLSTVYEALTEKGYNPVNQIVGYIMSGDPTYITSHKNARSLIMKVERDELVEELLTEYIRTQKPPTLMPTDCSVLRTPTILPNIRISWDYHPTFPADLPVV